MKTLIKFCFAISMIIAANGSVNAQNGECDFGGCNFLNIQHPAGPALSTTSTNFTVISTTMTAGKFALCNVVSGTTYEWSMCSVDGGFENFDGQLTLFNSSNSELCYSDDICGLDPKITWTATYTGSVKIQLNEYACITNNSNSTLVWRVGSSVPVGPGGDCNPGGCTYLNTQYPAGPAISTTSQTFSTITTDIWAGEHSLCNVVSGTTYEWSLCAADGASASYDSELTLYNGSTNAIICYSDDYCGSNAKISWTATFTGTVKIQVNQYNCMTNSVNTVLRWRAVGAVTPISDLAVMQVYTMGTIATPYSNPHVVSAIIKNTGTTVISGAQVSLSVTGANLFTDVRTITNLAVGSSTTVVFTGYTSSNVGVNNLTVMLPNDGNNTNNTFTLQQTVNSNSLNYAYGNAADIGAGFGGTSGQVAAKFTISSPTSISQVKTKFVSAGASYKVKIWDATGPGGTPGALLYTSNTTPTVAGVSTINISPAVNVSGSFFVGAEEIGTVDFNMAFQFETPNRFNTFYFAEPASAPWEDFGIGVDLRMMIEPVFSCTTPSNLSAITGPSISCAGSVITFQVPPATGVSTYNWTIPAGWSGSSSTNQITVTAGQNAGNITVSGSNACGTTPIVTKFVNIQGAPAQPAMIFGSASPCSGTPTNYNVDVVPGASSYTWTLPAGWNGSSATNVISVIPGAGSGIISVTANNSNCSSAPALLNVTGLSAPIITGGISGSAVVCANVSQIYSIAPVNNASNYAWNLPVGWTGSSTTNTITVLTGTSGGQVSVVAINACGNSNPVLVSVSLAQTPVPVITQNGAILTSSNAITYQWLLNGNVIPGANAQSFTPTTSGNYTVIITDGNGCNGVSIPYAFIYVGLDKIMDDKELSIYPNPAKDLINISVKGFTVEEPIYITNIIGVTVKVIPASSFNLNPTFTFNTADLNPGVYFVNAKSAQKNIIKKFVIQK
jgi:hypothetical protein